MNKSLYAHYRNKYPEGFIQAREGDLDVHLPGGVHAVAIRDGRCVSEQIGCRDRHDLSPIPRNTRFMKICKKTGLVVKDEKHDERRPVAIALAKGAVGGEGKVPSIEELRASGATDADFTSPQGEPHNASYSPSKGKKD